MLDRKSRKNHIIIFGLKNPTKEHLKKIVEINNLRNINLTVEDINNTYPLGRSDKFPIKVELISHLNKKLFLENCRKLRGTNVFITHDLTEIQREENKILRKHLGKATVSNSAYIKGNKLVVNNI